MDQLGGPLAGAFASALFLALITSVSGLIKAFIKLLQDFALLQRDVTQLIERVNGIEQVTRTGLRVMESRAGEEFLEPNPVTPHVLDIIRRTRLHGAKTLTREELLDGIEALDREWDEGHIPIAKRGAATRLLSAWNQELRYRDAQEALQDLRSTPPPKKPSLWKIVWPFS